MTPKDRFNQFIKDPARREALAAALADPAHVEASEIVKELMEPDTGTQADAAPAMAAAYYHQVGGANHYLKKLREMTREPVEKKVPKTRRMARTADDLPK